MSLLFRKKRKDPLHLGSATPLDSAHPDFDSHIKPEGRGTGGQTPSKEHRTLQRTVNESVSGTM